MATPNPEVTEETLAQVYRQLKDFSWEKVLGLLVMFGICFLIIRVVIALNDRAMARAKVDHGVQTFLRSGMKTVLWMVTFCIILGYVGVPMSSLVAVLSVLGLAVSLAVQGLLSNLAGGLMILSTHPFAAGNWVEAGGVSGTVAEVGLVYTKLHTVDNKVVYVPNGDICTKTIINYSAEEKRQVELKLSVSYDSPVETVKGGIAKVIGEHPLTFPTPAPFIRVYSYDDSSIQYLIRCWCATEDYWTVYYDLMEQIKAQFDQDGVEMTYPHLNVHMVPPG